MAKCAPEGPRRCRGRPRSPYPGHPLGRPKTEPSACPSDFLNLSACGVNSSTHSEVTRIFLEALADAGRPPSTATLVERIIQARGLDRTDPTVRKAVARRLGPSLRYTERKRVLIRSMPGPGQMLMWELVR